MYLTRRSNVIRTQKSRKKYEISLSASLQTKYSEIHISISRILIPGTHGCITRLAPTPVLGPIFSVSASAFVWSASLRSPYLYSGRRYVCRPHYLWRMGSATVIPHNTSARIYANSNTISQLDRNSIRDETSLRMYQLHPSLNVFCLRKQPNTETYVIKKG